MAKDRVYVLTENGEARGVVNDGHLADRWLDLGEGYDYYAFNLNEVPGLSNATKSVRDVPEDDELLKSMNETLEQQRAVRRKFRSSLFQK